MNSQPRFPRGRDRAIGAVLLSDGGQYIPDCHIWQSRKQLKVARPAKIVHGTNVLGVFSPLPPLPNIISLSPARLDIADIVAGSMSQDKYPSSGSQAHAPKQLSLSEEDESVMIAVRALDDMRSRAVPSPLASTSYRAQTCEVSSCVDA